MAQQNNRTQPDDANTPGSEVMAITDRALLAKFAEMASMVPAATGDGTENILAQILMATTWEQLDAPWESSDIDDILGKRLRLDSATRMPSTLAGGLGTFLVLRLFDPNDGKTHVKSTGSVAIVGQVAAAYAMNAMPLWVQWMRADKPTAQGFYPQHLKVLDSMGAGRDGS